MSNNSDMMPKDNLRCEVNPNAIDVRYLSCETTPLDSADMWSAIGSNAGAFFTFLLAVLALAAWVSSRHTLQMMREQIDEQKTATENAISADRQLAMDGRQELLLAEYCTDLLRLGNAAGDPKADLTTFTAATTTAWMNWGMHMFRIDNEFRNLTGEWNVHFNSECEFLNELIKSEMDCSASVDLPAALDSLRTNIGSYIGNLQLWQVDISRRSEVHTKFMDLRRLNDLEAKGVFVD